MPYDPNHEQWREYHVAPRYLAGTTHTGDPALQPLLDLGWHITRDDLGNVYLAAPDQTVRLGYLPESEDSTLWKIAAYRDPFSTPRWLVTYDDHTPIEIVADFTTALAAAYEEGPNSYLHHSRTRPAPESTAPLAAAGWTHRPGKTNLSFHSPDELAQVHLRQARPDHSTELGFDERWLILAGPPGREWCATASTFTPDGLVAAFTAAVANPHPVIRYGASLHQLPRQARAVPVEPLAATLPVDHRIQAARARSTAAATQISAGPPSTVPGQLPPTAPQIPRRPGR